MIVPRLLRGRWVIASPRPWHGLGNRIRSVIGTRVLARRHGREFAYAWPTGRHFGARLDELWNVDDLVIAGPWTRLAALRYPFRDATLDWVPGAADQRVWQVRTAHALDFPEGTRAWEPDLQQLTPTQDVAARISAFVEQHLGPEPYVGVMIRTHSIAHAQTLASSPVDWFIDRMRQLRSRHPDLRFFVSADTDAALDRVTAEVPGSVGQRDKGAYNSRQALKASVADLYLLAGSVRVLAAHYSSFPELAQRLAGPELAMETPADQSDPGPLTSVSRPQDCLRPHLRTPVSL